MDDAEDLKRQEAETFTKLLEADEEMRRYLHERARFPGEGRGTTDPMELRAIEAIKKAHATAAEAYEEWLAVHARLHEHNSA